MHSGKVRDLYADGDDLILVASDRVSAYDVVFPTPIPDKGRVLTALSLWWFDRAAGLVSNHVIAGSDVPSRWAGRAIRCRRLAMLPVECVVRGYLAGSGWTEYQASGSVCGVPLPAGLLEGTKLPEPIFTPTTKASGGAHDEPMTFDEVVDLVGADTALALRRTSVQVYAWGARLAAARGIVVADTKLEFGRTGDGAIVLADELLTPDSSRFWPADSWQPGRTQFAFDKQSIRDWASGTGWDRKPPAPEIPADVVQVTRQRYLEVFRLITGKPWPDGNGVGRANDQHQH